MRYVFALFIQKSQFGNLVPRIRDWDLGFENDH